MRYAVVSDVHANLEALTAVLRAIDAEGVDRIVCCGDLVGYYTHPNECLSLIQERRIDSIAGNHDRMALGRREKGTEWARRAIRWTRERLKPEHHTFLAQLPSEKVVDDRFLMVHASLHPKPNDERYLTSTADAAENFQALRNYRPEVRVCFFGHTHRGVAYRCLDAQVSVSQGNEVRIESGSYLINPGSVGQSRDGDPRASFVVLDWRAQTVRFHRVAYDAGTSQSKADREGLTRGTFLQRALERAKDFSYALQKRLFIDE